MVIDMNEAELETIEQIREFLAGTADVTFSIPTDESTLHSFVAAVLRRFDYCHLCKGSRGVLLAYMRRLTGYIRIDSVHQGDQDGMKGVYHINAVDIVTQWQLVAAVERISEAYLLPVIGLLLDGFPFVVRGFHSDSGSEYVNHDIARLL